MPVSRPRLRLNSTSNSSGAGSVARDDTAAEKGGFSGISGSYWVDLTSAQTDVKTLEISSGDGSAFGSPDAKVDKFTGSYALAFLWESDPSVTHDSVIIDLESYYVPKDNAINRKRIRRGTLVRRNGTASWKTAYLVDINDSGYPEVDSVPELQPYQREFENAVFDIAYNGRQPLWHELRLKYSKMLCAGVDVLIAPGGISS
jgi:hypothetical protein